MTPNSPKITDNKEKSEGSESEGQKRLAVVFCFCIVNFRQFLDDKKQRETHSQVLTQKDLIFKNPGRHRRQYMAAIFKLEISPEILYLREPLYVLAIYVSYL